MNLFSFENVEKSRSGRSLFEDLTLGLESGVKIGLMGANGIGKSSLLKLITGELLPDSGKVYRNKKISISYLGQQAEFSPEENIYEFILKDDNPLFRLIKEYQGILDNVDHPAYESVTHRMEIENGWGLENRIRTMLHILGIDDASGKMADLSGGMRRRAALARVLLGHSNLLILDEPTNHLDIPTIIWLQETLKKMKKAIVLVTHDRYLADVVCDSVWELDDKTIYRYQGGYSLFLQERARRLEEKQNRQDKLANILRMEMEWLSRGPRARTGKDKKRKQKVYNLMDKIENKESSKLQFSLDEKRLGKKVLELKKIAKSFPENRIVNFFDFEFQAGQKIGILGPNGAGKTTFLNILAGKIPPDTGEVDVGVNTKIGYFEQLTPPMKDMGVIEFLKETAPILRIAGGETLTPSLLLDWFQFPRSLHYQPISTLSGGERRRLFLVNTLLANPNFLILDEPTNDLDIQTLSALENFLDEFKGCLVVVSHDRYFLDRTVDFLFVLDGSGEIAGFSGNSTEYQDYLKSQEDNRRDRYQGKKEQNSGAWKKTRDNSSKLTFKEKEEFSSLENDIHLLETEQKKLEQFFSSDNPDPEKLKKGIIRFSEIEGELYVKFERWEELGSRETP